MKRFFRKIRIRKTNKDVPKMPAWDEIVEMLYDKNLNGFDDEVVNVIYSKDKSMRYIILKSSKGFFTYRLEKIYQFDEKEWNYRCSFDLTPAFWECVDNGNRSIFSSMEEVLRALEQERNYEKF